MTLHSILVDAGWVAVCLGIVGTYAQFTRAQRLGVEGVSFATWTLFSFMGCFWVFYGAVSAHSWQVILGSLLILPFQLAIVVRLGPWRERRVLVRSFVFFVTCCVMPTLIWGWAGGVYGTGVAMVANRGPQLLELLRHEDASGVSTSSWVLATSGSVLWIIYYTGVRLWAPLIATLFAGLANLTIAVLSYWRHRTYEDRVVVPPVFAD